MDIITNVHVTESSDKDTIPFDEFVEKVIGKEDFEDVDLRIYVAALQFTTVDLFNVIVEQERQDELLSRKQLSQLSVLLHHMGKRMAEILGQNFFELIDKNSKMVLKDLYGIEEDESNPTILGAIDELPEELIELLKQVTGKDHIVAINIATADE